MSFNRDALPEPIGYFEGMGLNLRGPGKWKTTRCEFHGGSDSMRVNTSSGAWVCMACGAKGGDVLANLAIFQRAGAVEQHPQNRLRCDFRGKGPAPGDPGGMPYVGGISRDTSGRCRMLLM